MTIQGKDIMDWSLFTLGKCLRMELVHCITVNFKYKNWQMFSPVAIIYNLHSESSSYNTFSQYFILYF